MTRHSMTNTSADETKGRPENKPQATRPRISLRLHWRYGAGVTLFGVVVLAVSLAQAGRGLSLPSYEEVRGVYQSSEARLLDRHGQVIHELRIDDHRRRLRWTALAEISPALIKAVVQAEDKRFYAHHGVDWMGTVVALWENAVSGHGRGASTITMQVASILEPALRPANGQRSVKQKWLQMRSARAMEREWSKAQILEVYLNLISYRGELQGIAAASRGLFGREPSGLGEKEALILAALIRGPNAAPEVVAERACGLGARMHAEHGCDAVQALARAVLGAAPWVKPSAALAPHVARQLLRPLRQGVNRVSVDSVMTFSAVARRSGDPTTRSTLDRFARGEGALDVVSTLDADVQRFATEVLQHQLQQLVSRSVRDGAVLAVDNASGEVLAYLGNAGNPTAASYIDGVQSLRQAGSTLKPFLYELALERRLLTAASLLHDAPVNLLTPTGLYVPQNYDQEFHGWVSVRTALAASFNVPAVRALMLVGVDDFADRLRRLGFSGLTEEGDYYGYSLALGSAEVTLWQLVNAYRALANGGTYAPLKLTPVGTLSPRERVGGEGYEPEAPSAIHPQYLSQRDRRVGMMDAGAAYIVSDVLADRAARSITFGLDNPLSLPFWAAVKTGTSKDMRDNWCIGYSRRFTVGVWVGNFNGEPMHDVSGVTGAAPVWAAVMTYLHRGRSSAPPVPTGVMAESVRFEPAVEASRREWFLEDTQTTRIRLNAAPAHRPQISYPGEGMVIALDPDIPHDRQRIFFEMEPPNRSFLWRLDGHLLSPTKAGWQPAPGRHVLTLTDAHGAVQHTVEFVVRGGARR